MKASDSGSRMSISVCAHGCVHMRFGATTISLSEEGYQNFIQLVMRSLAEMESKKTADRKLKH